jgi:hypothetical protein
LVVHAPIATPHVRAPTFRPGDAHRALRRGTRELANHGAAGPAT